MPMDFHVVKQLLQNNAVCPCADVPTLEGRNYTDMRVMILIAAFWRSTCNSGYTDGRWTLSVLSKTHTGSTQAGVKQTHRLELKQYPVTNCVYLQFILNTAFVCCAPQPEKNHIL